MSISASAVERDAGGRFLPGHSGNPAPGEAPLRLTPPVVSSKPREAGKVPGTRNRASRLRELLTEGEDRIIGRVLIDKAKSGDAVAARFVIAHLMPRPRSRAIELDLPEGTWAGDIVASFNATMVAMASGEITPDEALTITRTFDGRLKALKAFEIERHLTRYEKIPGDTAFEEKEVDYEEEEQDDDAPADVEMEPSPLGPFDKCSGGQGEGAAPANTLHPEENPHPDPLPRGEGDLMERGDAPADVEMEPSPCGRGQGEGASPANDLHPGKHPHPDPPEHLSKGPGGEGAIAPLHSACIQPSPATIAGRRLVAEQAMRQWVRTMPR
jgi:hypothetical protein